MILDTPEVSPAQFHRQTGWTLAAEGACKGSVCIPLPEMGGPTVDVRLLAPRLRMPLVHDAAHGLWCLGPESGGKVLETARAPDVTLPDWRGRPFLFSSLQGRKVLLVAWASW